MLARRSVASRTRTIAYRTLRPGARESGHVAPHGRAGFRLIRTYVRCPMPAPRGWLDVRNWLLSLTDAERRYIRAWIGKWMQPDGRIPHHSSFDGAISAPDRLDDLPPVPDPPRKGIIFKRPRQRS
jgi:hypothetical protein